MKTFIASFWNNQSGATAIEYAAFAMLIGVALVIALQVVTPSVKDLYALIDFPTK